PREDLTRDNARLLEMWLSNDQLRGEGHAAAERTVLVYRIGHPAIVLASRQLKNLDDPHRRAFAAGIVAYEAVSALVRSHPPDYNFVTVSRDVADMAATDQHSLYAYLAEADGHFREALPNTLAVIHESTSRDYPRLAQYAVHGAALACQLELQVSGA
ncbi:MAG TPA: hypothetical protein VGO07_00725, partial [Candidatus Saccharimonadales bacterium]|nr:hypothetical protein [Candidatus Saccharimonadales bacterium]